MFHFENRQNHRQQFFAPSQRILLVRVSRPSKAVIVKFPFNLRKIRILAEAEAQAEKLEDMAKRNIEQEFKTAKANLQKEIAEKAMEKAEEVIKASISSDDQDKLVDDYLKKVVA